MPRTSTGSSAILALYGSYPSTRLPLVPLPMLRTGRQVELTCP